MTVKQESLPQSAAGAAGMFPPMPAQSFTAGSNKGQIKPMMPSMPHMPFCLPQQQLHVEHGAAVAQDVGSIQHRQQATDAAADVDSEDAVYDEDVEVEEETWCLFEKVAAMERAKQAERAGSPCASIHSAATGASADPLLPRPPQQLPIEGCSTHATTLPEAATLPWLSLGADGCDDDLDDDLAQLISLPEELSASGAEAEAASASGPVCSLKKGALTLKRVSSTGSAQSSGDVLATAVAKAAGATSPGTQALKPKKLRIQLKKSSASGSPADKPAKLPVSKSAGVSKTRSAVSKSKAPQAKSGNPAAARGAGSLPSGLKAAPQTGSQKASVTGSCFKPSKQAADSLAVAVNGLMHPVAAVDPAAPGSAGPAPIMIDDVPSLSLLTDSCFGSCDALSPMDFDSALEGSDGGWESSLPGSEFDLAKLL
eukprot:gene13605-13730_t